MVQHIAARLKEGLNRRVVCQEAFTDLAVTAFFAGGHLLVEGPIGSGKTTWSNAFARLLGTVPYAPKGFSPAKSEGDYSPPQRDQKSEYVVFFLDEEAYRKGHSTNIIELTDESWITVMQEDGTHETGPFFLVATVNPGEPFIQNSAADRFIMKLSLSNPGVSAEKQLLQMIHNGFGTEEINFVLSAGEYEEARREINEVAVNDGIFTYIVSIVETARRLEATTHSPSPRGSIALLTAAKAHAAIAGRNFVTYQDIQTLALPTLCHRLHLTQEAESEGFTPESIIGGILAQVKPPQHAHTPPPTQSDDHPEESPLSSLLDE